MELKLTRPEPLQSHYPELTDAKGRYYRSMIYDRNGISTNAYFKVVSLRESEKWEDKYFNGILFFYNISDGLMIIHEGYGVNVKKFGTPIKEEEFVTQWNKLLEMDNFKFHLSTAIVN